MKIEPLTLGIRDAVEEVDENAGVKDDHVLVSRQVGAHRVQIALPFDLPAPLA